MNKAIWVGLCSVMVKYLVGIDEVGRGPLAGPVCIGVCVVSQRMRRHALKFFKDERVLDSKKLDTERREEYFQKIKEAAEKGRLDFRTSFVGHAVIDKRGLAYAIRLAVKRSLGKLSLAPNECRLLLDGGLKGPAAFRRQQTIIDGDETEPLIALASIVAKVRRDRRMIKLAKLYPAYGFEKHKGYGTRAHYKALKKNGPSAVHRRSFLKNL
ncbi:MAG: ribonuclease HII [Candidatus Taylorbacteria bacterium]|nr:ribonuclease HII [Candidatus Taylorbacteria bacterium]